MNETAWTPTRVTIACRDGKVTVDGWVHPAAPGLAVTEGWLVGGYRVTHIASGCSAFRDFGTMEEAMVKAETMGSVIDWTVSAHALAAPDVLRKIRAAHSADDDAITLNANIERIRLVADRAAQVMAE